MKRTSNGKYAKQSAILKEKMIAPSMLILTTAFTWGVSLSPQIYAYTEPVEIVETLVAPTPEPTPEVVEPTPEPKTQKQEILEYIIQVFGDNAVEAIKIAECESQFNPQRVGDQHLMSINLQTGEEIGDSIGIFQIRTGDTTWNRAKANGMSVPEFRNKLTDYHYNIDYAKTIYDNAEDWHDWYNCMNKVF